MGDGLTLTPTDRTGRSNGKKALIPGDLSHAAALLARLRTCSGFAPITVALRADSHLFHGDLCFGSKSSLHKTKGEIVAQISAPLCSGSGAPSSAESEKVLKNIAKARKNILEPAKTRKSRSLKSRMTILVV